MARGGALPMLFVLGLLCLVGCGGSHYELAPVRGVVRLDGVPLADVRVEFVPETTGSASRSIPTASAVTGAQGEYQLQLPDGRMGVPIGKHRVIIEDLAALGAGVSREEADEVPAAPTVSRVPDVYRLAGRTPLHVDVQKGSRDVPLDLSSKGSTR